MEKYKCVADEDSYKMPAMVIAATLLVLIAQAFNVATLPGRIEKVVNKSIQTVSESINIYEAYEGLSHMHIAKTYKTSTLIIISVCLSFLCNKNSKTN